MALPYHLFVISTQVPGMPLQIQYGTALVLLTFVLSLNIIATLDPATLPPEASLVDQSQSSESETPTQ